MLGDKGKEIAANSSKSVCLTRTKPISLYADAIHEVEAMTRQAGAYFSNFEYAIRYTTNEILTVIKHNKPFLIRVDLLDNVEKCGHRVASFEELCSSEKYKEFVPFLLKYTKLSKKLFSIAKANPNVDIPMSFDIVKYVDDVKAKYKKEHGVGLKDFTFWSKDLAKAMGIIKEDKTISRDNARKHRLKGVVE